MNYKKETLIKENNELYDHEHLLNDKDVAMANVWKILIENGRSEFAPKAGDVFVDGKGVNHHIDEVENEYYKEGTMVIVENAYTPFLRARVNDSKITLYLSTSGGPFKSRNVNDIKLIGEKDKRFCFFGHGGARANGAVELLARVNVWSV